MFDATALGAELFDAAESATPVALLTERFPELTWEQAREIARATDGVRRNRGQISIGFKLGWTSAAMRDALGIDRPNWGTLWNVQRCTDVLNLGSFLHPKVEPELVFRSNRELRGKVSTADVAAAGGSWALGLEVVDPRFRSFSFKALDNTADNSSAAAIIVGAFGELGPAEVEQLSIEFSDGNETRHGVGSNAMESPIAAVAWLVRQLETEGSFLAAGDIVFTGGLTAPFDIDAGARYKMSGGELGSITLKVE